MSGIRSGQLTALFLYDVAEAIDLEKVGDLAGPAVRARLAPKATAPSYVQYQQPPLAIDAEALRVEPIPGYRVRFKVFDYGVVSVALTHPLPDSWPALLDRAMVWHEDQALAAAAERLCRDLVGRVRAGLTAPHETWLSEDYLIFSITAFDDAATADDLVERHGGDIARLLRGEPEPLSRQERDEVLRHRISYLPKDLVIPTWSAALVYDTESGAQSAVDILEFANSQLLEFRYYDELLDREMARIYSRLEAPGWFSARSGRRYTRAAQQIHSLFIDVNQLTDRTENALKVAGDVYTARVFALAASRLGLNQWKANVEDKLETLDDIYRFAVERTGMARGEVLELTIVAILVFELVLFFMGIMR